MAHTTASVTNLNKVRKALYTALTSAGATISNRKRKVTIRNMVLSISASPHVYDSTSSREVIPITTDTGTVIYSPPVSEGTSITQEDYTSTEVVNGSPVTSPMTASDFYNTQTELPFSKHNFCIALRPDDIRQDVTSFWDEGLGLGTGVTYHLTVQSNPFALFLLVQRATEYQYVLIGEIQKVHSSAYAGTSLFKIGEGGMLKGEDLYSGSETSLRAELSGETFWAQPISPQPRQRLLTPRTYEEQKILQPHISELVVSDYYTQLGGNSNIRFVQSMGYPLVSEQVVGAYTWVIYNVGNSDYAWAIRKGEVNI